MTNSDYLFYDPQDFFFGEIAMEQIAIVARKAKISTREVTNLALPIIATFSIMTTGLVGPLPITISNFPWSLAPPTWDKSPDLYIKEVRNCLIRCRKYLGLSQSELAETLGVSPSTIEKFEQELNMNPTPEFLKKYVAFNELGALLKTAFNDRKFLARSILKSPLSVLEEFSPLQFAQKNPKRGIFHVLGALRRIYG